MSETSSPFAISDRLDLSVVVIAFNEEKNLGRCLQSLPRGSEIVVLDSSSTDATAAIARAAGARVEQRVFTTFSEQKNAAVDLATRRWIFSVDADEVLDETLRSELSRLCKKSGKELVNDKVDPEMVGYRVRRRLVFMGRKMKFGKTVDAPLRLFRKDSGRFEHDIHEVVKIQNGTVGIIAGELDHYSYADLSDYFVRFNSYTSKIAHHHLRNGRRMPPVALHVLRPWSEFFVRYVLRLGFLDGYPGYCYALLSSLYTYVKYAKLRELLHAKDQVE